MFWDLKFGCRGVRRRALRALEFKAFQGPAGLDNAKGSKVPIE